VYTQVGIDYDAHYMVNQSAKQYAYDDVTTNSIDGLSYVFKRGMKRVYRHFAENDLQRYINELTFRSNRRTALGLNHTMRAKADHT